MSAPQHAAAWDDLPLGLQQHILVMTGSRCARRVSKAWRDAFDAANDTLCFRHSPDSDQSLEASATAAATRIVNRSTNLTAVDMVDGRFKTSILSLSDLLAAGAASGLATRLRKLTGVAIKAARLLRMCPSKAVYLQSPCLARYLLGGAAAALGPAVDALAATPGMSALPLRRLPIDQSVALLAPPETGNVHSTTDDAGEWQGRRLTLHAAMLQHRLAQRSLNSRLPTLVWEGKSHIFLKRDAL